MTTMMSTRMTRGGQTTVPKEIRTSLGIGEDCRVYWSLDNGRAILSVEPPLPNQVSSEDEFWHGIDLALSDVSAGRMRDAREVSSDVRGRLDLA